MYNRGIVDVRGIFVNDHNLQNPHVRCTIGGLSMFVGYLSMTMIYKTLTYIYNGRIVDVRGRIFNDHNLQNPHVGCTTVGL